MSVNRAHLKSRGEDICRMDVAPDQAKQNELKNNPTSADNIIDATDVYWAEVE